MLFLENQDRLKILVFFLVATRRISLAGKEMKRDIDPRKRKIRNYLKYDCQTDLIGENLSL